MSKEALQGLLEQRLGFVQTIADTTMVWWVSSIVFCGALIAGVWLNRSTLLSGVSSNWLNWLCFVVTLFLATLVAYPMWIIYGTSRIEAEIAELLQLLGGGVQPPFDLFAIRVAVGIGASTFVLVFITWLGIWRVLAVAAKSTPKDQGVISDRNTTNP